MLWQVGAVGEGLEGTKVCLALSLAVTNRRSRKELNSSSFKVSQLVEQSPNGGILDKAIDRTWFGCVLFYLGDWGVDPPPDLLFPRHLLGLLSPGS